MKKSCTSRFFARFTIFKTFIVFFLSNHLATYIYLIFVSALCQKLNDGSVFEAAPVNLSIAPSQDRVPTSINISVHSTSQLSQCSVGSYSVRELI